MKRHRTFLYENGYGTQIAVEVWEDGIDVKVRPTSSAIWSRPLDQVSQEGDPVQFAFEEES